MKPGAVDGRDAERRREERTSRWAKGARDAWRERESHARETKRESDTWLLRGRHAREREREIMGKILQNTVPLCIEYFNT